MLRLDSARAVIFDWDGVIADTRLDFKPIRDKYFNGGGHDLLSAAEKLTPALQGEVRCAVREEEMRGAREARLLAGARELTETLTERGVKWCVISRNCSESIELAAGVIGFNLPDVTFSRDAEHVKPDPRAMLDASYIMGVEPRECLAVGDYSFELLAARRAGMRAVLVNNTLPACVELADACYADTDDFRKAFLSGRTFTPWEYHKACEEHGLSAVRKMRDSAVRIDVPLTRDALCELDRLAGMGLGEIQIDGERIYSVDEARTAPLLPLYLHTPLFDALEEYFSDRYPLLKITAAKDGTPLSRVMHAASFRSVE